MDYNAPSDKARVRDPERTRAAIIAATLEIIEECGEAGVRVSAVARSAGVTTGAIYAHFGDREDLITHAQVEYLRVQALTFSSAFVDASQGSLESAEQAGAAYMDFMRFLLSDRGQQVRLRWLDAAVRSMTDERLQSQLAPIEFALLESARMQVEAMQTAGYIDRRLDPRAVAAIRVGTSLGSAVTARVFASDPSFSEALFAAWPYVVQAFAPRTAPTAEGTP